MGRLRLPLLLAAVLLALPAAASADHVQPSAQVSAAFNGPVKKDGSREMSVTWSQSCTASGDDEPSRDVELFLFERPKSAARAPERLSRHYQGEGRPSGSDTFTVGAGTRAYAEVRMHCESSTRTEVHTATAVGRSEVLYVPPRTVGWGWGGGSWCYPDAPPFIQTGYLAKVRLFVIGSPISLLPVPGRQGWRDIRIRLSGAGVKRTVRANARWWARGYVAFSVRARRVGKLKATPVFDGDPANSVTVPVRRPPGRCRQRG